MGKQRREQSQDSIFVDNPFVDGFLEWMGSREGRQCIEVRDVLVSFDTEDSSIVYIDIRYAIGETNDPRNLVFPFYVIPPETT